MIIMSNHNQGRERSLADEFREISVENANEKITLITDKFKREVKIASVNGRRDIEFVLVPKENFVFINNETIQAFKEYLDMQGFILYDYRIVDESDVMGLFHYFKIGW